MSDAPQHEEATGAALNTDAYCPNCRYNLRGLSGDPIRCPECGGRYMRVELRWPKHPRAMTRQERARRDLQRSADLCAVATIPGLVGGAVLLAAEYYTGRVFRAMTIASAVTWLLGFALFAWRCRGLPKWGRALAAYQLAAVPAMVVDLVLVAVAWGVAGGLCAAVIGPLTERLLPPLGATSSAAFACVVIIGLGAELLAGLAVAWLVVRFDPMAGLKRLGADRLNALADRLAEQMPPPANATKAPPTGPTVDG